VARIFLSLGSNVDAQQNLRLAVRELKDAFGDLRLSPVYRNQAVGFDGDDFLNLVAGCDTDRSVEEIVGIIESIHRLAGRERGDQKFSSRPLDIDLLLYGDLIITDGVRLPRPDVLRYSFVLKPLVDIAADTVHPETRCTVADHWARFDVESHPLHEEGLDLD